MISAPVLILNQFQPERPEMRLKSQHQEIEKLKIKIIHVNPYTSVFSFYLSKNAPFSDAPACSQGHNPRMVIHFLLVQPITLNLK